MKKNVFALGAMAFGLVFAVTGCGAGGELRQEMMQERQEDIIDEREDERLQAPGVELRRERQEDRIDELEDRT